MAQRTRNNVSGLKTVRANAHMPFDFADAHKLEQIVRAEHGVLVHAL